MSYDDEGNAVNTLERIGYLCIQGYPHRICSGCTSACNEPVFAYPEIRRTKCPYDHPDCDGDPLTCMVRESEAMGLYDGTEWTPPNAE